MDWIERYFCGEGNEVYHCQFVG